MADCMDFPNTFKEFIEEYSFKDREEIYTNGSDLIQVFRVMQGYEHFIAEHDKQIRDVFIKEIVDFDYCKVCHDNGDDIECAGCCVDEFQKYILDRWKGAVL